MMNFIGRACLFCLFVFKSAFQTCCLFIWDTRLCIFCCFGSLLRCVYFQVSVKQLRCQVTFLGLKFFKYSEYEKMPNNMAMDYDNKNTQVQDVIILGVCWLRDQGSLVGKSNWIPLSLSCLYCHLVFSDLQVSGFDCLFSYQIQCSAPMLTILSLKAE